MCAVALLSALSYVLTAYCAIPYAGGFGYFNFGDIVDLLAAFLLGPLEGMFVGMLGGVISDLAMGYGAFALWTLLAKGLLGLAAGLGFALLRPRRAARFLGGVIGAILEILTYMLAYFLMEGTGALYQSAFDAIQALGSLALAIPLYLLLEKAGLASLLQN